jgi:hypothetical protein
MNKESHQSLVDALELHQNLIHAEQQAISCRDLNIIEDILKRKDESLQILINAKLASSENYSPEIESRISRVLDQQKKNTVNFRKLHIHEDRTEVETSESNPLFNRMRKAYFS